MREVIVIGLGAAGVSAAIELKRNRIEPLVIGKDGGALGAYPGKIENVYGLMPIKGQDLYQIGLSQLSYYGISYVFENVLSITEIEGGFLVKTDQNTYSSQTVLLATGKTRIPLDVPGYQTYLGKGISLCAACDGYFFRKKKIALIGHGAYLLHELEHLKKLTDDILIFSNDKALPFPIIPDKILEFKGDKKLREIKTDQGVYPVDGVFFALGSPSLLSFASQLGLMTENQSIVVDSSYQTNIPGLFAAGDAIGGKLQIPKASYDGIAASYAIMHYLKK